ncbi:ABC transporter substrate-binding protein [Aureimonas phyllosphaerae]|uniref:Peptide/nickel transport system substrate-binding protein/oligopeptide transport system substrate-binding protein n=1 Tax=Aureimonas phyllosphaerae TaxID=1166078 RepID=A0A7W6FTP8_9HYPH|nr:ABC transporter substrate-binding protein [Aureimonas phyllosphaerae]MBB3934217.1 peptide/nickel transport system substrate-binding protein/oligopeptide transport system substrate-binding protein [Aureimonas phyllosphaerae]MBB3958567.1 peptide/nickel transport system substrate-binding protein/oligopeptide transport system substrate-binding protein [Aureimonas phyllosphaerae]SFE98982.1 peptide/nickel transport system substrate-binding protein/oligopeptide transport system substrate-binding pro
MLARLKRGAAALAISAAVLSAPMVAHAQEGDTITVTYKDDIATLDPAIGYDWQNFSMIKAIFDGLMDYEPGTAKLRPGLAESYEISPDGKVFTFKLRDGVKFHNGRAMTAEDVKYSFERTVNPATQSPGAGFLGSIEGFEAMQGGTATELSGVKILDPKTVQVTLSRPDATFLSVMALNFSFIVPKEEVEKSGADFGRNPVGTGAFKLAEWTLGQRLVLEKNPDYYREGAPKLGGITFEIGQEPVVSLLRVQNGEVDVPGDGIPPAKFREVMGNPAEAAQVVEGVQLHTGYITMNTKAAPFDDLKVRQAVNMAINKDRIVQIINGRATPANQPLPPTMPGYIQNFEGYKYDVEAAKKLLAEAGHEGGFETELFVANVDPQPRIAQAIQQDLAAIGIKASLQSLAQANVIAAGGSAEGAPMIWSGGMAWIADFPDPSNFYGPILGCSGAAEGGWNWAKYCNEALDEKAAAADAMVDPAKAAERAAAWGEVYKGVMADAPWVPVFNEKRYTMRSARMGGDDALYIDPVNTPMNYRYVETK